MAAIKFAVETATPPSACPLKKGVIPKLDSNKPAVDMIPAVAIAPQVPQIASPARVNLRKSDGSIDGTSTSKSVNKKTTKNSASGTMTSQKECPPLWDALLLEDARLPLPVDA